MTTHAIDTHTRHACGGTILAGPNHAYCDRCHAFAYDGARVPAGTDEAANRQAWDDGEFASPDWSRSRACAAVEHADCDLLAMDGSEGCACVCHEEEPDA